MPSTYTGLTPPWAAGIAGGTEMSAARFGAMDSGIVAAHQRVTALYGSSTLFDQAVIATDATLGTLFTVTLAGNRTLGNPTGLVADQRIIWRITQDATGGRTLTLGSIFNVNTAVTGPISLSPAPASKSYIGGVYDAGTGKIDVLAFGPGF